MTGNCFLPEKKMNEKAIFENSFSLFEQKSAFFSPKY